MKSEVKELKKLLARHEELTGELAKCDLEDRRCGDEITKFETDRDFSEKRREAYGRAVNLRASLPAIRRSIQERLDAMPPQFHAAVCDLSEAWNKFLGSAMRGQGAVIHQANLKFCEWPGPRNEDDTRTPAVCVKNAIDLDCLPAYSRLKQLHQRFGGERLSLGDYVRHSKWFLDLIAAWTPHLEKLAASDPGPEND